MRTERQIEASRANGAKSRGPVTPEGKRNSCGNALKHGLLADFEHELQPETTMEYLLMQKMAAAQWRQFRLWGMEKAAMEYQIRKQAGTVGRGEDNATLASLAFQTLSDDSRSLDLFHRYDSVCDRQYLRAHKRFLELRRSRGASLAPMPPSKRYRNHSSRRRQSRRRTRKRNTTKRTQQVIENTRTDNDQPKARTRAAQSGSSARLRIFDPRFDG
jgi:hypothetical protein